MRTSYLKVLLLGMWDCGIQFQKDACVSLDLTLGTSGNRGFPAQPVNRISQEPGTAQS